MKQTDAYILLGGNQGPVLENFQKASELLALQAGKIKKQSSLYRTAPWGLIEQPDFYNQLFVLGTTLSPTELIKKCLEIEAQLGRVRTIRYAPRLIDIDILFYGSKVIVEPGLEIPHPRMHERRFALAPMREVAPLFEHPLFHETMTDLLAVCTDGSDVNKI